MRGQVDNTDYYEQLGKKLLKIREEKKLLQKDIASQIGITFQQWQKYEKGTNRIPTKALVTFCEITQTNIKELTGCTVGDYEKVYKEEVVNYNTNNNITNVYNYNGFFSNLFNMDLALMKNKIALSSIIISLFIYLSFSFLKFFSLVNSQYNIIFMQIQILGFMIAFAVTIFVVFGYNILSYLFGYVAFYSLIAGLLYRAISGNLGYLNDMTLKASLHLFAIALTFLTFYILKKCKVNPNANLKADKQ